MADANNVFRYALEVYIDDFISIVIPASQEQLCHIANAIMEGIHDIFPPDNDDTNDPLSEKKLLKRDSQYDVLKTLLGIEFDGVGKTLWLKAAKREKLLTTLHTWIGMASCGHGGVPFNQSKITIAKLRHAFAAIPAGVGLLSPCNRVLAHSFKNIPKIRRDAGSLSWAGQISLELSMHQAMVLAGFDG